MDTIFIKSYRCEKIVKLKKEMKNTPKMANRTRWNNVWKFILVLFLIIGNFLDPAAAYRCDTCRLLVETFKHGLKETERSHFGGGDTAWEVKKLGRYSRSETRLVEVFEEYACKNEDKAKDLLKDLGLNADKENEHRCHLFLEEHEETIENWYFHKQTDYPNFHKWLCIDTLKLCCPQFTFGPDCKPCPGDTSRPCFGQGDCDGAGTREGTGKCKCYTGYYGNLCRKCSSNYYATFENDTHVTCQECDKSCKGGCTKEGPAGCNDCKSGWKMVSHKGCEDIDECVENPCQDSNLERCTNVPGSYECLCMDGYKREGSKCVIDVEAVNNSSETESESESDESSDEVIPKDEF